MANNAILCDAFNRPCMNSVAAVGICWMSLPFPGASLQTIMAIKLTEGQQQMLVRETLQTTRSLITQSYTGVHVCSLSSFLWLFLSFFSGLEPKFSRINLPTLFGNYINSVLLTAQRHPIVFSSRFGIQFVKLNFSYLCKLLKTGSFTFLDKNYNVKMEGANGFHLESNHRNLEIRKTMWQSILGCLVSLSLFLCNPEQLESLIISMDSSPKKYTYKLNFTR